jgi:hypothetical protein
MPTSDTGDLCMNIRQCLPSIELVEDLSEVRNRCELRLKLHGKCEKCWKEKKEWYEQKKKLEEEEKRAQEDAKDEEEKEAKEKAEKERREKKEEERRKKKEAEEKAASGEKNSEEGGSGGEKGGETMEVEVEKKEGEAKEGEEKEEKKGEGNEIKDIDKNKPSPNPLNEADSAEPESERTTNEAPAVTTETTQKLIERCKLKVDATQKARELIQPNKPMNNPLNNMNSVVPLWQQRESVLPNTNQAAPMLALPAPSGPSWARTSAPGFPNPFNSSLETIPEVF